MLWGYIRQSKKNKADKSEIQRAALEAHGVAASQIFADLANGRTDHQPNLTKCLKLLEKGDILVVFQINDLASNAKKLAAICARTFRHDADLRILRDQHNGLGSTITANDQSRLIFDMLRQFENERVTRERAIRPSRAIKQVRAGRPFALSQGQLLAASERLKAGGTNISAISREIGVTTDTFYKYLSPNGELKPAGQKLIDRETDLLARIDKFSPTYLADEK